VKILEDEKKVIIGEIDSIRRFDKVSLTWWQMKAWGFIRWAVIRLIDKVA